MNTAVVISNERQYEALSARLGGNWSEITVFCDTPSYFEKLNLICPGFIRLDDFQIQDRWVEANAWGRQKAAEWIDFWRQSDKAVLNLAEVIFLDFGYALVQMLKNLLLAQMVIERYKPSRILLFEGAARPFPEFSGNSLLNRFLETFSAKEGILCERIALSGKEARPKVFFDARSGFVRGVVKFVKWMIKKSHALTTRVPVSADVLIYGSLRHLDRVTRELKKQGLSSVIYDFDFHADQFRFARQEGIEYLLPVMFEARGYDAQYLKDLESRFNGVMELSSKSNFFHFNGIDLSDFIRTNIFADLRPFFLRIAREKNIYTRLADRLKVKAILVDEDFGPRSFFVSFMAVKGIKSFCISHANFAVDFSVDKNSRHFGKSTTIVHSEFEKETYAIRGWDSSKIKSLGTPRYDTWIAQASKNAAQPVSAKRPFRLLCVGAALYPFTPNTPGYLGCHVYNHGELQKIFLKNVLEAAKDLPIEVLIKPHDVEDEPLWRQLALASPAASQVKMIKSSEDFVKLLLDCDAMTLSAWSNTMVEAVFAGKPVFYIDIPEQKSPILDVWKNQKYCNLFTDSDSLRSELIRRINTPRSEVYPGSKDSYYLGPLDGQSAARIANEVQNVLKGD